MVTEVVVPSLVVWNIQLLKDDKTLKSGYLLSPKDISTAEILDKVLATGVDSLKSKAE